MPEIRWGEYPPSDICHPLSASSRRRGGFLLGLLGLRPGIEALGGLVAIHELDHGDRCGITIAEAGLEHAGIAAVALLVAGAEHLEELLDHGDVADLRDRLAARMQVAALAERDELLDHRT